MIPCFISDFVRTSDALNLSADSTGSHWVTIEHEHVCIKGGRITKGPAGITGKKISELPDRHQAEVHPQMAKHNAEDAEAHKKAAATHEKVAAKSTGTVAAHHKAQAEVHREAKDESEAKSRHSERMGHEAKKRVEESDKKSPPAHPTGKEDSYGLNFEPEEKASAPAAKAKAPAKTTESPDTAEFHEKEANRHYGLANKARKAGDEKAFAEHNAKVNEHGDAARAIRAGKAPAAASPTSVVSHAPAAQTSSSHESLQGKLPSDDDIAHFAQEAALESGSKNGMAPIHALRDKIKEVYGEKAASPEVFDRQLKNLRNNNKARLVGSSSYAPLTSEQEAKGVQGAGEKFAYVNGLKPSPGYTPPADNRVSPTTKETLASEAATLLKGKKGNPGTHGELLPIHELRDHIQAKYGDYAASHKVFDKQLMELRSEGKARTVSISENERLTPEQHTKSIPREHETHAFISDVNAPEMPQGKSPADHLNTVAAHVATGRPGGARSMEDFKNSAQFGADKASYPPDVEHSLRQAVASKHIEAIPREAYPSANPAHDDKLLNIGGKAIQDFRVTPKGRAAMEGSAKLSRAIPEFQSSVANRTLNLSAGVGTHGDPGHFVEYEGHPLFIHESGVVANGKFRTPHWSDSPGAGRVYAWKSDVAKKSEREAQQSAPATPSGTVAGSSKPAGSNEERETTNPRLKKLREQRAKIEQRRAERAQAAKPVEVKTDAGSTSFGEPQSDAGRKYQLDAEARYNAHMASIRSQLPAKPAPEEVSPNDPISMMGESMDRDWANTHSVPVPLDEPVKETEHPGKSVEQRMYEYRQQQAAARHKMYQKNPPPRDLPISRGGFRNLSRMLSDFRSDVCRLTA